jgi:hypothetical protein
VKDKIAGRKIVCIAFTMEFFEKLIKSNSGVKFDSDFPPDAKMIYAYFNVDDKTINTYWESASFKLIVEGSVIPKKDIKARDIGETYEKIYDEVEVNWKVLDDVGSN